MVQQSAAGSALSDRSVVQPPEHTFGSDSMIATEHRRNAPTAHIPADSDSYPPPLVSAPCAACFLAPRIHQLLTARGAVSGRTREETDALVEGVQRCGGAGKWQDIKRLGLLPLQVPPPPATPPPSSPPPEDPQAGRARSAFTR